MFVESAIRGVEAQQIAFACNPFQAGPSGLVGFEYEVEGMAFQRRYLFVFDDRRGPQCGDGGAGFLVFEAPPDAIIPAHAFDIEVQKVAVENAVRKIWAGVVRAAIVNCVQWIERDEIHTQGGRSPVDQVCEIAEVAASPVASGTQAVERDAEARVLSRSGEHSPIRCDDETHHTTARPRFVISERQFQSGIDDAVFDADMVRFALLGDDLNIQVPDQPQRLISPTTIT